MTQTPKMNGPLRVGIGGPVGAGKTTLTAAIARALHPQLSVAVITNDIYTQEDAEALMRMQILPQDRVMGVETGGCPHTAIREDASINLAAVAEMRKRHADLDIVLIESGGDNLSATFSPELADLTIYVIDVAAGEEIPRKGGPATTKSDLLLCFAPCVTGKVPMQWCAISCRRAGWLCPLERMDGTSGPCRVHLGKAKLRPADSQCCL